jgi:hypothetical protein
VRRLLIISFLIALSASCIGQTQTAPAPAAPSAQAGGTIHGTVKSGTVPLPGVSITATNTLTGKKYSTVTDATGTYSLAIPQNGRYVVRTDFAAFAAVTKEALLNATSHDQQADFVLTLASRAQQQEGADQTAQAIQNMRQYGGSGSQNLNLLGAAAGLIQAGGNTGTSDASLPSLANNSDFSNDSVAISGQSGSTNPFAGMNMDQMRQNMEDQQFQNSLSQTPGGQSRGGGAGGDGVFIGGPGGGPGGGGGGGGGGPVMIGGGGRGRGNFRNFKPNQPHGAFFWTGGNSALNAQPFSVRGATLNQPSYLSNHFGLTFVGAPYIPKLLQHDTKDFIFFTLAGNRSSSPFNQYGTVPTVDERGGDLSALTTQEGSPVTIYNPAKSNCTVGGNVPGQPFSGNIIPASCIAPQATGLLNYMPVPNLSGSAQNYQNISTSQTNTTNLGFRYMRSFGSNAGSPIVNMIRQYMGQGGNSWRQSVNANFNYSHNAADELNIFPELGGKEQMHQYSVQAGYSLGKGKLTNNLTLGWNRSNTELSNYFTNTTDVAQKLGINIFNGIPTSALNYGLPNLSFTPFTGFNEQQPNFHINQTISLSQSSSWIHKKNNIRFGGDFRRVHLDMIGQANSTGTFYFTGLNTQEPGSTGNTGGGTSSTGSPFADFLLGLPQQTALQAPYQKAYLRANVFDLFAQDSWQALPNFTVLAGLRYEYFSPYSEKNDRIVNLDAGNNFTTVIPVLPNQVGPFSGRFPRTLVEPEHLNFSPRVGFAWRAVKDTVVRFGYGINFANGQYVKFIQDFAFQPPFANVQTNEATTAAGANITLANGFPGSQTAGNYAVHKNYRLPYVQVWNLDVQHTFPLGIVLNVGYNGTKGTRLDIVSAPGRTATETLSGVFYDWEDSLAFSNFNALAVRLRKRMQHGIAIGATYTYSHSIDNASSIGGNGGTNVVVAQNWQDLLAEKSNSSFDVRHNLKGDFVYELPFGPDTHMLTNGNWLSHTLANMSLSGTFNFASGQPLTPAYEAAIEDVARGSAGSLRPDRVPGSSLTAGGGSIRNWFNRSAFTAPAATFGTASRYSIPGPGTVSFNASLSKSVRFGDFRNLELRATASNVFNTVQYSGVDSTLGSASYGQVTSAASMRSFTFLGRYRF